MHLWFQLRWLRMLRIFIMTNLLECSVVTMFGWPHHPCTSPAGLSNARRSRRNEGLGAFGYLGVTRSSLYKGFFKCFVSPFLCQDMTRRGFFLFFSPSRKIFDSIKMRTFYQQKTFKARCTELGRLKIHTPIRGDAERLTVAVLKDWLKSQGVANTGKKQELLERVRSCVWRVWFELSLRGWVGISLQVFIGFLYEGYWRVVVQQRWCEIVGSRTQRLVQRRYDVKCVSYLYM